MTRDRPLCKLSSCCSRPLVISPMKVLMKNTPEHSMDVVFGQADRVLVLVRGRLLAEGTPEQIQADARVQEAYLGAGFDVEATA